MKAIDLTFDYAEAFSRTIEVVETINSLYKLSGKPVINSNVLFCIVEHLEQGKPLKSHLKKEYCLLLIEIERAYQFISGRTGVLPDHSNSLAEYKLFGFYPNDERDVDIFTAAYCDMLEEKISFEVLLNKISRIYLN